MRALTTVCLLFVLLALGGCAPVIHFEVTRAPVWDTDGVSRIAVMPFEHGAGTNERQIAVHLAAEAAGHVLGTGRFTLVPDTVIQGLRAAGAGIEEHVDALLTGKVIEVRGRDSTYSERRYHRDTVVTVYNREAALTVSYSLELTRGGSVVVDKTRAGRAGDTQYSYYRLKSMQRLLQECSVLSGLAAGLAPYTVIETRALMAERSKDKVLRREMKGAAAHVKRRDYGAALGAYKKIYGEFGTFAAVYNASVMHEALGETRAAIELMERAAKETGDPEAQSRIARLNRRLQREEMPESDREAAERADKAVAHASGEALGVLSPRVRVWIVNTERREREQAAAAADGIAAALARKGVIIVDRENAGVIETELMQVSGGLSDSDILNAGSRVGAGVIIVVTAPGTGIMRRLQIRILDVEKGVPVFQSGLDSNWNI